MNTASQRPSVRISPNRVWAGDVRRRTQPSASRCAWSRRSETTAQAEAAPFGMPRGLPIDLLRNRRSFGQLVDRPGARKIMADPVMTGVAAVSRETLADLLVERAQDKWLAQPPVSLTTDSRLMEVAQFWSTELMGSNRSHHGSGVQDSTASVHAWELVSEGEPPRARLHMRLQIGRAHV